MRRRPTGVAFVLVGTLLVQLAWILVVPPFGAIDEIDHVYRAASVARGEWRAGAPVADGRGQRVVVPSSLVTAARPECESHRSFGPDNCVGRPAGAGMRAVGSGSGSYNPAFYAVVGLPSLVLEGRGALYGMRALAALLCAVAIGAAAWCLRRAGTGPAAMMGLVVAMTPVFAYSTTVVAPNGIEMSAGVLLWCALLALGRTEPGRTETYVLTAATVAAVVLVTTRSLGPLFTLLVTALVLVVRGREVLRVIARRRRASAVAIGSVAAATALSVWWIASAKPLGAGGTTEMPYISPWTVFQIVPTGTLQAIAAFPYRDEPAPIVVYPLYAVAAVTLAVLAFRRARAAGRIGLAGVWLLSLLVPLLVTFASYRASGLIWQGRYGLPLSVGGALLAGVLLADGAGDRPVAPRLLLALAGLVGLAGVLSVAGLVVGHQKTGLSIVDPGSPAAFLVLGGAILAAAAGYAAYLVAVGRSRAG